MTKKRTVWIVGGVLIAAAVAALAFTVLKKEKKESIHRSPASMM